MEIFLAAMLEDGRQEQSPIFLLSITVPDILKQSKLNDPEVNVRKSLAPEDLHGQKKNNLPYNY